MKADDDAFVRVDQVLLSIIDDQQDFVSSVIFFVLRINMHAKPEI